MRFALIAALALACDDAPAKPIRVTEIENLVASDRGELIRLRGTVHHIGDVGRRDGGPHLAFHLSHGDHDVEVVSKGVLPERFREGVTASVTGRWVATATVRDDLDREGFTSVNPPDIVLARDVIVLAPDF